MSAVKPPALVERVALERPVARWLSSNTSRHAVLYKAEGGRGKTTLKQQIIKKYLDNRPGIKFVDIDLADFQSIEYFLWQMREQLDQTSSLKQTAKFDFAFDRFDFCLNALWEKQDPLTRRSNNAAQRKVTRTVERYIDMFSDSSAFDIMKANAGEFLGNMKLTKYAFGPVIETVRRNRVLKKCPMLHSLRDLSVEEMRLLLIEFFWGDLEKEKDRKPGTKCVFLLDNHHSMQDTSKRWASEQLTDSVERVFRQCSDCLLLLFSRYEPPWWGSVNWDRKIETCTFGDFTPAEIKDLVSSNAHLSEEAVRQITERSCVPVVVHDQLRFLTQMEAARATTEERIEKSVEALGLRMLDSWGEDEQICLGVLSQYESFDQDRLQAVIKTLHLFVGTDFFGRVVRSSACAHPADPEKLTFDPWFKTAVSKRLEMMLARQPNRIGEVAWLTFTEGAAKRRSPLLRDAISTFKVLEKANIDDQRLNYLKQEIEGVILKAEISSSSNEPAVAELTLELFSAIYMIFKSHKVSDVSNEMIFYLTVTLDLHSEVCIGLKRRLPRKVVETSRSIAGQWVVYLRQVSDQFDQTDLDNSIWYRLWAAKLSWNRKALEGRELKSPDATADPVSAISDLIRATIYLTQWQLGIVAGRASACG